MRYIMKTIRTLPKAGHMHRWGWQPIERRPNVSWLYIHNHKILSPLINNNYFYSQVPINVLLKTAKGSTRPREHWLSTKKSTNSQSFRVAFAISVFGISGVYGIMWSVTHKLLHSNAKLVTKHTNEKEICMFTHKHMAGSKFALIVKKNSKPRTFLKVI